jgi:hypothetical protein
VTPYAFLNELAAREVLSGVPVFYYPVFLGLWIEYPA